MDEEDPIATFQAITGADRPTAEHVLEAHGGDLNRGVNFFMESAAMPAFRPVDTNARAPPDLEEDEAEPIELGGGRSEEEGYAEPARIPEPPRLRAHPVLEHDDDLRAALAASLRTGDAAQPVEQDEDVEDVEYDPRVDDPVYDADDEVQAAPSAAPQHADPRFEEGGFSGLARGFLDTNGPRVRRNRPRGAAVVDANMSHLAAMGMAPHALPPPFAGLPPPFARHLLGGEAAEDQAEHSAPNGNGHIDLPAGINMEEARMLESAMMGIPYEGRLPDFRDQAPAEPVSPSVLRQRELREEQDQAFQESLWADRQKADAVVAAERAKHEELQQVQKAEESAAQAQRDYEREISDKLTSLPEEPPAQDPDSVAVMIRLPNGTRISRRFLRGCPCQDLFNFVDVNAAPEFKPGSYRLVTQFPRRTFAADKAGTLAEAGLDQKQEALLLEPL